MPIMELLCLKQAADFATVDEAVKVKILLIIR